MSDAWKRAAEGFGLLLILAVGASLRLLNGATNPGFYSDEGTLLDITHHLLEGEWRYMALNQSTLIVARMPLFPLLLAMVSSVFGEGIASLRLLAASLNLSAICMLYLFARRVGGRALALASAFILAIHPEAVFYSRVGFSYNLLAALIVPIALLTWEYLETRQATMLWGAGLIVGIGAASDLLMMVFIVPLLIVASTRGRRALAGVVTGASVPIAAYLIYMLATAPEAFLFDLRFTFSRLSAVPLIAQFPVAVLNYARLLHRDPWFIPAIIGVFVATPNRARWFLMLFLLLPLLVIGRSVIGLEGLGYYYLIPILPMAAIGIAVFIVRAGPLLIESVKSAVMRLADAWNLPIAQPAGSWTWRRITALLISLALFVFLASPFLISGATTVYQATVGFASPIDYVIVNGAAARQAAAFINSRTDETDLVIASPAVAWLLDTRVADFQQAIAIQGKQTLHLPTTIPANRFEYDVAPSAARYVVIDRIWRNWAAKEMPAVAELLEEVQNWPLVFEAQDIAVYVRPAAPDGSQ